MTDNQMTNLSNLYNHIIHYKTQKANSTFYQSLPGEHLNDCSIVTLKRSLCHTGESRYPETDRLLLFLWRYLPVFQFEFVFLQDVFDLNLFYTGHFLFLKKTVPAGFIFIQLH